MVKCNIGGFCVNIYSRYDYTDNLCKPYIDNSDSKPLFDVSIGDDFLQAEVERNPHLAPCSVEHIYLASTFYRKIIPFGAFMLHASCILYKGRGYLFSAPSKTGKSTHTRMWQKAFGEENVNIINDDKPLIYFKEGAPFVCGTPFCGGSNLNTNVSAPIGAIVFLEQNSENGICKLQPVQSLPLILDQTTHKNLDKETCDTLLDLIETVISTVPIYKLKCNISTEAAILAEKTIVKEGLYEN